MIMSWTASAWASTEPAATTVATTAWAVPSTVDAFAHLRDTFDSGNSDPTARDVPWQLYKSAAGSAVVSGGSMAINATQGGSGATGSLIYTQSNTLQYDGFMVYVDVGPGAATATPVAFDVRADITATNAAGSAMPTVNPSEWRFCPLGVHNPSGTYYNYIHVAPGADPNYVGVEVKDTSVDAVNGESIYPVAEYTGSAPLRYQVRIVRRATNTQIFDVYQRYYSGQDLSSNDGWTRRYTIDRSATPGGEDDFPARPNSVPLPDTVRITLAAYSNAVADDILATVHEFWIGETTD